MEKRALLIGINYIGTSHELQGCIYDVIEMKSLLIDAYGFNPMNIITLRDDDPANAPTRARILQEIQALLATPGQIFLHYSGHGTQIKDSITGDESDRLDECIAPCDYSTAGFITDDELNVIAKGLKGKGLAIFDSCRSGTIMDLPFTGITVPSVEGFYCFSGCQDNQDAVEDVTNTQGSNTGLPQGAMTMAFISTIRSLNYYPTISALYTAILANLKAGGYTQIPQLTSTASVGPSTPFPFSSPSQQLSQQQGLIASLQTHIQELQIQLDQFKAQASLVAGLTAQVRTLATVQAQLQALQTQDDANVVLIADLKKQIAAYPILKDQSALVVSLQRQVSHLPGLQRQMEGLISQVQSMKK